MQTVASSKTSYRRDLQLDAYRALIMIYVPCVIHVLFWLEKGNWYINSLCLIEMPVIFFISGATMYITGRERGLVDTVRNRGKRLLLPYCLYILFCLFSVMAAVVFVPELANFKLSMWKIIFVQDNSLPVPYMSHLWFVIPYLIVSCSFPIQRKWADRTNPLVYMLILAVLCLVSTTLTSDLQIVEITREAVIFNFFFMAGYLFYQRITKKILILITSVATIIVAICLWHEWYSMGYFSIQSHKFPPDAFYLVFGISSLGIMSLLVGYITIPHNRLIKHWSDNGYTIYLWQNFSFIIYTFIYNRTPMGQLLGPYHFVDFMVATVGIFILSTLTGIVIAPVERRFFNLCTKLAKIASSQKRK